MKTLALTLLVAGCAYTPVMLDVPTQLLSPIDVAQRHCEDDWKKLRQHNGRWGGRVYYFPEKDWGGALVGTTPSCAFIHKEMDRMRVRNHAQWPPNS